MPILNVFLFILQSNSSMDLSNEPSQQNIPQKRGQCNGVDYSNIPTLEPCDIVLQFTRARGKKTTQCVLMDNV